MGEVIGATGSTLISHILPAIAFLLIFKLNPGEKYMRVELENQPSSVTEPDGGESNADHYDDDVGSSNHIEEHGIQVTHNPLSHQSQVGRIDSDEKEHTNVDESSYTQPVFTYEELRMWRYLAWILLISGSITMPCCLYTALQP